MEEIRDGQLRIVLGGTAGNFGNNVYVVIDAGTGEAAFIDAPDDVAVSVAAAEAAGVRPSKILLTHGHFDHTASIEALKERYGCALYSAANESGLKEGQPDVAVGHDDEVAIGNLRFKAIHNPGHTPGSTTFVCGKHAFVGDTLFPGGPGRSASAEKLQEEIASITSRLYALPGDTRIWPGHGPGTTIGESKAEYADFASRPHDPDLHGDVLWATS